MRIAVLGAGNIGGTIGGRWQAGGHQVVYGVRNPDSERYGAMGGKASVTDVRSALEGSDAVLIAIAGGGLDHLLASHGEALDGKLLIDATNSMGGESFHRLPLFQSQVPAARVFRAFSTLGWENFAEPAFDDERADLFYAGPDGADRTTVEGLIEDVGLRPVYVGEGVAAADALDGVTRLWFALALQRGHGRHLAFRTLGIGSSVSNQFLNALVRPSAPATPPR